MFDISEASCGVLTSLFYDVADKHYLSHVLKERVFREIAEEINMTGNACVKFTIDLPNLKLYDAGIILCVSNHRSSGVLPFLLKRLVKFYSKTISNS